MGLQPRTHHAARSYNAPIYSSGANTAPVPSGARISERFAMVKEKKIPMNFLFKGKKVSRSARGSALWQPELFEV
jgi:hypothetical protein